MVSSVERAPDVDSGCHGFDSRTTDRRLNTCSPGAKALATKPEGGGRPFDRPPVTFGVRRLVAALSAADSSAIWRGNDRLSLQSGDKSPGRKAATSRSTPNSGPAAARTNAMRCVDTAVIDCRPTAAGVFEHRDWLRPLTNLLTDAGEHRQSRQLKRHSAFRSVIGERSAA